jgi:hypothetical protein
MTNGEGITQGQSSKQRSCLHFWKRRIPFLMILTLLGMAAWHLRDHNSPPISVQGGKPFQNFVPLETPAYMQNDD